MQRIIFRHLSGSKANQVEEFPADTTGELVFGRDDSSQVKYDPARDDLVSRQHAKLVRDPANPGAYFLEDLGSRNGTFLNKQRVSGRAAIAPGDMVQFGPGGPEFQFDLDPRPQAAPPGTREASIPGFNAPPATREGAAMSSAGMSAPGMNPTGVGATGMGNAGMGGMNMGGSSIPPSTNEVKPTVGKATVERMITQTKNEGRKTTLFVGLAGVGLVALVGGLMFLRSLQSDRTMTAQLDKAQTEIKNTNSKLEDANSEMEKQRENAAMSPSQVVAKNGGAIAELQVGWKLIYTPNGNQVYHQFATDPKSGRDLALYQEVDGSIEPVLTTTPNKYPIGGEHTGSGFCVTSDGFMLTNRHVAACWKTAYHFPPYASPGIVKRANGQLEVLPEAPRDWVPSETKQAGQTLQGGFEGRNDYFYATFPGQSSPNPVRLARVSDRHDVAMVKIDTPGTVDKVDFNDNYDTIKPGDGAVVLGYPGISPGVYGVVRSQDVFNRSAKVREIPDPTVSVGNIGRILRGNADESKGKDPTVSLFGDAYQLTINSTGPGNSGGPVFDDKGRVTAIFFAGKSTEGTAITFAVPIRYGEELMNAGSRHSNDSSSSSSRDSDSKSNDRSSSTRDKDNSSSDNSSAGSTKDKSSLDDAGSGAGKDKDSSSSKSSDSNSSTP